MLSKPEIIRKIDELKIASTLLSADSGEEFSNINERNTKTLVSSDGPENQQMGNTVLVSNSRQTAKDHRNPLEQLVLDFRNTLEAYPELQDTNEADARNVQKMYSFIQDGLDKIIYHTSEPSSAIASLMSTRYRFARWIFF